ncbi:MAG: hypothetical protein U0441_12745 [Polyangiaceae bacterium]
MRTTSAARFSPVLMAILLAGCGPGDDTSGSGTTTETTTTGTTDTTTSVTVPAPVVNEQTTHADAVADDPFEQDVPTLFRTPDVMEDTDVRSLIVLGTTLYIGTATGLFELIPGASACTKIPTSGSGAILDMAVLDATHVVLAREGGVEIWDPLQPSTLFPFSASSAAVKDGAIYLGNDTGLYVSKGGAAPTPVLAAQSLTTIHDLLVVGDVLWIASPGGLHRYDIAQDKMLPALKGAAFFPSDDTTRLAAADDGSEVLVTTATSVSHVLADGSSATIQTASPGGGLPTGAIGPIAQQNGQILIGHTIGATALGGDRMHHYHSLRWLPDDQVTAVALGPDGTRYIGTPLGLTRVERQYRTLEEKAALYEPEIDNHFRMDGIVADEIAYADPWDQTTEPLKSDFDNDGLWTEMQVGAWCLAYAETGDDAYYQKARKAMDTLFLFFDVPGESFKAKGRKAGFITRSLVRDDEGALFDEKASQSNWHLQAFGDHQYYWKDDTSSDEYAGHYFGIPLFYDLCAKTDQEKKDIRDRIDLAMSYVVDGGYQLIDLDGQPTKFGRWDNQASAADGDLGACLGAGLPNCASSYGGGGWLNSMEILGALLAAWHITGDDKYYLEYNRLAIDERYGDMVPMTDHYFTVTSRNQQNHSDHELASLAYFTLLRYEPNADRREKWVKSIQDFYGYESLERNALEIAVMSSAMDSGPTYADGVRTLREWPLDRREWAYDNSHRVDVEVDMYKDRFDDAQFTTVLPYDEIRTLKWNGNPYAVAGGGDGRAVQGPWPFLLPYWMMRHSKAIQ